MANNTDPRTAEKKLTMAKHFEEYEADYREEDWCSIVYEDDQVVVVADHKGYEFSEWEGEYGTDFSEHMHHLARQVTDHSWSADYPIVFDKMEN